MSQRLALNSHENYLKFYIFDTDRRPLLLHNLEERGEQYKRGAGFHSGYILLKDTLGPRKSMTKFVHQKSSITAANIAGVFITLFVLSSSKGMELKFLNQELHNGNHDQNELHKNMLDQVVLRDNVLDQSKLHQGVLDYSRLHKRTLDQSGLDQTIDQQGEEVSERSKPSLKSEYRPKRAVFDILPEGLQRATGGRRISFERRDDQLLQFSKRKEEKDRMKSMLKKYFKTLLNNKKQEAKRYSSLRVCRFTFMKICQRIAQIGK